MAEETLQLGNYLILGKLAHGGMAQIYKAKTTDPNGIERLVVIKRILPHISSNPEYIEMLIDEAKIAVNFTHGNIAQIYDLGKVGDDYFIVMEYVDGKTLGQILREFKERGEKIPLDIIVYCLIEIFRGLDYMHRKLDADGNFLGVVHRDISPQNIIVSYSGTVKIIDFGVAKATDKMGHTESGVLKGKFAYMSPEQTRGDNIDKRSDIFSAAILLWELLTLQRLFKRKTNKKTIKAIQWERVRSSSKYRQDVPKALDKIIKKALRKWRRFRYQTASDIATDLSRFLLKYNPEFRPMDVAQFLYKYFGPEADERHLPPEIPVLEENKKSRETNKEKKDLIDEEKTQIDRLQRILEWLKGKYIIWGLVILVACVLLSMVGEKALLHYYRATLVIDVNPKQASILVNDRLVEQSGGHTVLKYPAGKKLHIKITVPGYQSQEFNFNLNKREVKDISVVLEKEVPPFGDLYITSVPPGARIYLDDMEWGQITPAKIPHLNHKKNLTIGLFMDGYRFAEKKVEVVGGELQAMEFKLEYNYGILEINSSPEGASVIIDDQVVGKTPYINNRLNPNEFVAFRLEMEGYKTLSTGIRLKPGEKKILTYELKE